MLKETSKEEALIAALEGKPVLMLYKIRCPGEPDDMITVDLTATINSLTNKSDSKFLIDFEEAKGEQNDEQETAVPIKSMEKSTAMKADGKKKGGRKSVDSGKIIALKNAGWDYAKIADELRCSVPTVKKYIRIYNAGEPEPQD